MNDMNSLILEGQVKEMSASRDILGAVVCNIVMATRRFYRTSSGEPAEETAEFKVECKGAVAEYAARKAYHGRGIRVVGNLRQRRRAAEDGKQSAEVYIFAEHIEYKPDLRKKQEEEK